MEVNGLMFNWRTHMPHKLKRKVGPLLDQFVFGRPFKWSSRRVLAIYEDNRISVSQIFPYIYYANDLDIDVRAISRDHFENETGPQVEGADLILLQTWFDLSVERKNILFEKIRRQNPDAKIVYLDSFAPTDLRLADMLDGEVDLYIKKHLLCDLKSYQVTNFGDTNLMDYYGKLYGLEHPDVHWPVSEKFAENIIIGPGFYTSPNMMSYFSPDEPPGGQREVDIHARLASNGSGWYQQMREQSIQSINSLSGLSIITGSGVPLRQFIREMKNSKLCFSPFGYGEVCWRDIEAFGTGSLLIKPDMSHLKTNPDLFIPYETYIPVSWDFSNLEEKVRQILADDQMREEIAFNAYSKVHKYLAEKTFVDQMKPIFELVGNRSAGHTAGS